jgi:AcrR family transcriptional regulator
MSRRPQRRRPERDRGPVWVHESRRGRRPAWSREQIVAAAIELADAEGWDAVSMRRIASELGAGTMSLYHYVRTRDDLAALVADAIMGELIVPEDELPDGWRDGLAAIARRTRAAFERHPWLLGAFGEDDDAQGPNGMRHFEQSLGVAARTGVALEHQFAFVMLVDEYVFGYAMHERGGDPLGPAGSERERAMLGYVEEQLATGDYPHMQALAAGDLVGTFRRIAAAARDEGRFERGLQIVLDGIGVEIGRLGGAG